MSSGFLSHTRYMTDVHHIAQLVSARSVLWIVFTSLFIWCGVCRLALKWTVPVALASELLPKSSTASPGTRCSDSIGDMWRT
jgi:hypothetical protein